MILFSLIQSLIKHLLCESRASYLPTKLVGELGGGRKFKSEIDIAKERMNWAVRLGKKGGEFLSRAPSHPYR